MTIFFLNVFVQNVEERIIGCTGVPADSHDVLWFNLYKDELGRCTECGSGKASLKKDLAWSLIIYPFYRYSLCPRLPSR